MVDYTQLKTIGKSLYQTNIPKEMKRYLVFLGRCCLHKKEISDLQKFFRATPLREKMLAGTPSFLEQTTRGFFYKGATWAERINIVKKHITFLEKTCKPELLRKLYVENEQVPLWQDTFQDKPLTMELWFHGGQRKEGCLSLVLIWGEIKFYQIMFWLGPSREDKKPALWIGALQGTSLGNDVVKAMTKQYFGYRTKNLVFYGIRTVAKILGCARIYAVTNEGYYAMNHLRMDRKLKTNFGDFWTECGGEPSSDPRFYEIPIEENRKDMSEMKPSKRANHRRRYELMDKIEADMAASFGQYIMGQEKN